MKYKNISVFFPAYNEADNIKQVIVSTQRYLRKYFSKYQIIVVNDGSTDNTKEIVKLLAKKDKFIELINHKNNQGYGAALRSGFATAKYSLVFYTDSDNQFDISDLEKLLPLIEKNDIVSGYRIKRQDPLMRIFISSVYNIIITLLFHPAIRDIDASFKLYKKEIIASLNLKSDTGFIDAEIFIKARKKGYTIAQVGVKHFPRLKGKTIYEVGNRNNIFAFVRPKVVVDIFKEIHLLWKDLQ